MSHKMLKTNNIAANLMDKTKSLVSKITHNNSKPKESLILITGGTGFVATWVINEFLAHGYRVRTTVRNAAKGEDVKSTHSKYADRLEIAIVEDITPAGAHDEAVQGVAGVVHTASPFVTNVEDNEKDLLYPAIEGTKSVLASIAKHAPQVKRVVITSSFASIMDPKKLSRPGHTYSEKDWNPTTYEEAKVADGMVAYTASKTFAEKAALDFVKEQRPNFTIAAINPPMVYGPLAQKIDIDHLNTSAADMWKFLNGSMKDEDLPEFDFPACSDVRNVAQAHLRAYELDTKKNERYFIVSGAFTNAEIVTSLRRQFPERAKDMPDPSTAKPVQHYEVDNSKSRQELGIEYVPIDKTIADTVNSLLQVEAASKKGTAYDGQEWFQHV